MLPKSGHLLRKNSYVSKNLCNITSESLLGTSMQHIIYCSSSWCKIIRKTCGTFYFKSCFVHTLTLIKNSQWLNGGPHLSVDTHGELSGQLPNPGCPGCREFRYGLAQNLNNVDFIMFLNVSSLWQALTTLLTDLLQVHWRFKFIRLKLQVKENLKTTQVLAKAFSSLYLSG